MRTFQHFVDIVSVAKKEARENPLHDVYYYQWRKLACQDDQHLALAEGKTEPDVPQIDNIHVYLAIRGQQGWELVQWEKTTENVHTFVFKRDAAGWDAIMQAYWEKEAYEDAKAEAEAFRMPPMFPGDDD